VSLFGEPAHTAYVGRKVAAFLADTDVKKLFDQLDQDAYDQFKAAKTDQERTEAWALALGLDMVKAALQGAVQSGDLAAGENPDLQ
jgi:hypothetical protein